MPLFVNTLAVEIVYVPAVILNVPVFVVSSDTVTVPAEIVAPSGPVTLLSFVKISDCRRPGTGKANPSSGIVRKVAVAEETAGAVDGERAAVE